MKLSFSDLEHARAFAPRIVDVPSLNAHVSSVTVEHIERVRKSGVLAPSSSLLVLGPAGAGKTHLFERMRRRVGPAATFVHIRPEIGIESSLGHVLLTVLDALKQRVADREYSQLDVVVGSALAVVDGDNPKFPSAFIDKARAMKDVELDDLIQRAIDRFEGEDARLDAAWLELFLGVPFMPSATRRAALTWLSGREPSELELRRLGRTEPMAHAGAKSALRALATVAAQAAPLVIVFDQLENLVEGDGRTDRVHAHARVFAELFDEVSRMVLVQMALDGEWVSRIRPELGASERSRLEANIVHVALPSAVEREELLRGWLDQVPPESHPGVFPAPFTQDEFTRLATTPGMTPRMLFVAARKALEGERPFDEGGMSSSVVEELDDMLARSWDEAVRDAHAELDRAASERRGIDESRLAAAIRVLLLTCAGTDVHLGNGRGDKETLRFARNEEETLVFVVQSTNGRSVATILGHASKVAEKRSVLVVREQALSLPPTWKLANENLERLRALPRVRVVDVGRAEMARSLAMHDFVADARSQDLAGPDGTPVEASVALAWADKTLDPATFVLAFSKLDPERSVTVHEPSSPGVHTAPNLATPTVPGTARAHVETIPMLDATSAAISVLSALRLASVERVVAEVQRREPRASRARVLAELRAHPDVRWFGRTLVHLPSEAS